MRLQNRAMNVARQLTCSLLPSACTLTHAFASCATRTQRTSLKHRRLIIAQHRGSCRWSTPERKVVRAKDELGEKPKHKRPNKLRSGLARHPCSAGLLRG